MLVLSRKEWQSLDIGPNIRITIVEIRKGQVRIGIDAPKEILVTRTGMTQEWRGKNDEPPAATSE